MKRLRIQNRWSVSLFGLMLALALVFRFVPSGYWEGYRLRPVLEASSASIAYEVAGHRYEVPSVVHALWVMIDGSERLPPLWVSYAYLVLIGIAISGMLAVAARLRPFWFWTAQALWGCILYSTSLDQLQCFGWVDAKTFSLSLIPWIALGFAFHRLKTPPPLWIRWSAFGMLFALQATLWAWTAHTDLNPLLQWTYYAYYLPVCAALAFAYCCGGEIIYLGITITTYAKRKGNLWAFVILSFLYLSNLILYFLKQMQVIEMPLYLLDPLTSLMLASVVGFWGLSARQPLYASHLGLNALRCLYALAGMLFYASVAYYLIQRQDAAYAMLMDVALFAQIGFASGFIFHILLNFASPLYKGLAVWRIAYHEEQFPYLTGRAIGLLLILVCTSLSSRRTYHYAVAGYYSGLATLYSESDTYLAEVYDQKALQHGYRSHLANYRQARRSMGRYNPAQALYHYDQAQQLSPTPQAALGQAHAYEKLLLPEKSLAAWRSGAEQFPYAAGVFATNVYVHYARRGALDSAQYEMERLMKGRQGRFVRRTRAIQQGQWHRRQSHADSVLTAISMLSHSLQTHTPLTKAPLILLDSALSLPVRSAYWNNLLLYAIRYPAQCPVEWMNKAKVLSAMPSAELLESAFLYAAGDIRRAFRQMDAIQMAHQSKRGLCFYWLAAWSQEQGQWQLAADFLARSREQGYAPAQSALVRLSPWIQNKSQLKPNTLAHLSASVKEEKALWPALDSLQRWVARLPYIPLDSFAQGQTWCPSPMQRAALLYKAQTALRTGQAQQVRIWLKKQIKPSKMSLPPPSEWAALHDELLFLGQQSVRAAAFVGALSPVHQHKWLWAYAKGNKAKLIRIAQRNPFQEGVVVQTARRLQVLGAKDEAYQLLLEAIDMNPYGRFILQEYALCCWRLGLENYARHAYERLQQQLSARQLNSFRKQYEAARTHFKKAQSEWD